MGMKISIIGQGYVGLNLAMAIPNSHQVIGFDVNAELVSILSKGQSHIEGITSESILRKVLEGSYIPTTNVQEIKGSEIVIIAVPTPLDKTRKPDLTFIESACKTIGSSLDREALIINESTSFPGTLRDYIKPLVEKYSVNNLNHLYAISPERVDPGNAHWNQKNTPRLVGGINLESQAKALAFYESICDAVVSVSTPEIAEAAKLLENTFRLVNIALINEFTQLCSANGINVHEVIDAASSKPYGFMPFKPGVGVGGHCIPVDPLYLTWWARQNGGTAEFVESADSINHAMPKYVAQRALAMIDESITNPKVLILGVAYKPGVGDVRETPVSDLRDYLRSSGAEVAWHDPLVPVWEGSKPVDLGWECDVAILATNQPGMDVGQLIARGVQILDCTNSITGYPNVSTI